MPFVHWLFRTFLLQFLWDRLMEILKRHVEKKKREAEIKAVTRDVFKKLKEAQTDADVEAAARDIRDLISRM